MAEEKQEQGKSWREWILAPDPPDEATVEKLCEGFRAIPRIAEAWVVGSRTEPQDGSAPPRESTTIALVLDPPLPQEPPEVMTSAAVGFFEELRERVPWSEPGRGWLLGSASLLQSHEKVAVKIYARSVD